MKVLLVNGSAHAQGCTYTALSEVEKALLEQGLETEWFQMGAEPIRGCIGCNRCGGRSHCCFEGDAVNRLIERMEQADALVVGSPVYYASANGGLAALLDRAFYAGGCFAHKPAAAVVSARRAGTTAALDELHKYFTISQMPVVSSTYWPMVHGNTADEVRQDAEGLQIMRNLGRNLAWLLRCIQAGAAAGAEPPQAERGHRTNFIR